MPTYLELKAQAEALLAQAEELRLQERNAAIALIKEKVQAFGLTAQDLGLRVTGGRVAGRSARKSNKASGKGTGSGANKAAAATYRGPNGESWSGGRGRKPKWVTQALASGKTLDDLRAGA